jgi:acyl-CoA reductase-like NAD-dependent aldehyde dehydrogenase
MTNDQLQQLKTFCTWLEQFSNDVQAIIEPEQAVLDRMSAGFTEVKHKQRIEHLRAAADLIEQAHKHLALAAFEMRLTRPLRDLLVVPELCSL